MLPKLVCWINLLIFTWNFPLWFGHGCVFFFKYNNTFFFNSGVTLNYFIAATQIFYIVFLWFKLFQKLELANVWHFWLKMERKDLSSVKIVALFFCLPYDNCNNITNALICFNRWDIIKVKTWSLYLEHTVGTITFYEFLKFILLDDLCECLEALY